MVLPLYQPLAAHAAVVSVYVRVATLTLFFYNFVLKFPDEVKYVWSKKLTIGSLLYVVGRYTSAACLVYGAYRAGHHIGFLFIPDRCDNNSEVQCSFVSQLQTGKARLSVLGRASQGFPYKNLFYPTAIVVASAMALLQLRTYALYKKSKVILYTFGVVNLAATIVFIIEDITFTKFNYSWGHRKYFGVQTSGWSNGTSYSPFFWATFSFNEVVTFALVLYKAWQVYSSRNDEDSHVARTIIDIVMRDNIIYFSIILITYLSGFLLCLDTQLLSSAASTHLLVSIAVSGMLAPNLYLDLKRKFYANAEEPYYTTFSTVFEAAPIATVQSIEMSTPDEWEGHEEQLNQRQ